MHGTCGLNNPWHHLRKVSNWVGNPGRPPYVIPCGSAGLKKKKGESDFLQSPLLQSSLWPMAFLVITIGCFCCCLKRPIYCCGTQLCDYSHESATNHRQAMLLRQDAERGNESIKMTNIPLHNDVPQTNDNTATTKHDTPLGAIPQNKNPPPLDAKCKPKPTLSSVPSTLSLVKI